MPTETDAKARERLSKLFTKNTLDMISKDQEIALLKDIIRTFIQLNDERTMNGE